MFTAVESIENSINAIEDKFVRIKNIEHRCIAVKIKPNFKDIWDRAIAIGKLD
jgi:hypothetical protein